MDDESNTMLNCTRPLHATYMCIRCVYVGFFLDEQSRLDSSRSQKRLTGVISWSFLRAAMQRCVFLHTNPRRTEHTTIN
jgi:hypothetical protein